MNIFILPALWEDISGEIELDNLFIRTRRYGEQWLWQRVRKLFPGVYRSVGKKFLDWPSLFKRVERRRK